MSVVKFPGVQAGKGWSVGCFGKNSDRTLPIGRIATLANGVIWFRAKDGEEYELTEEEAHAVSEAFQHARFAARERKNYLSGFTTLRVSRSSEGAVTAQYRGETFAMRRSNLRARPWRRCQSCKQQLVVPCTAWVGVEKEQRDVLVCVSCVDRLATAPTEIRLLDTPAAEVKGA